MKAEKLQNLAMNDNGFIFDPNTGYSYTTNETGMFIMRRIAQGETREQIMNELCEEYDCSADHFNSDFDHFMLMLDALDLIDFEALNNGN